MQHAGQEEDLGGRQNPAVGSVCKTKLEEMEKRKHRGMEGWREEQGQSKRRGRKTEVKDFISKIILR